MKNSVKFFVLIFITNSLDAIGLFNTTQRTIRIEKLFYHIFFSLQHQPEIYVDQSIMSEIKPNQAKNITSRNSFLGAFHLLKYVIVNDEIKIEITKDNESKSFAIVNSENEGGSLELLSIDYIPPQSKACIIQ